MSNMEEEFAKVAALDVEEPAAPPSEVVIQMPASDDRMRQIAREEFASLMGQASAMLTAFAVQITAGGEPKQEKPIKRRSANLTAVVAPTRATPETKQEKPVVPGWSNETDVQKLLARIYKKYQHSNFTVKQIESDSTMRVRDVMSRLNRGQTMGLCKPVTDDRFTWRLCDFQDINGAENQNFYQILRGAFDKRPFTLADVACEFPNNPQTRLIDHIERYVKEELIRESHKNERDEQVYSLERV